MFCQRNRLITFNYVLFEATLSGTGGVTKKKGGGGGRICFCRLAAETFLSHELSFGGECGVGVGKSQYSIRQARPGNESSVVAPKRKQKLDATWQQKKNESQLELVERTQKITMP